MAEYSNLRTIQIPVYGDCLPTTTSYHMRGNADNHDEASVKVAVEVAAHEDDNFLAIGFKDCISRNMTYPCSLIFISPAQTWHHQKYRSFHEETMSAIMGVKVKSLSPRMGNVICDLRRLILSRNMRFENIQHIMWTNCASLLVCPVAHGLAGDRQTISLLRTKNRTKTIGPNG